MSITAEKDIIIKCSVGKMAKSFFKDFVVVWHDPNLTAENKQYTVLIERLCKIETFTDWQKASSFIQKAGRKCYVITSGTDGELFVREINKNENVSEIYVFCRDQDNHSDWTKNYHKISCVENEIGKILEKIEQRLLEWYKQNSSLKSNLPAFAPIFNDVHKSQMNHLHLCLKVIPSFNSREQAKSDFIRLSREVYLSEQDANLIADFEKDYNEYDRVSILRWYTQDSFLYKVVNNCLRIGTSDSIQYCRLPLKDIQKAIQEVYHMQSKNFHGLLYRGTNLSQEEWSSLKENEGKEIEMHGFLSTSKDQYVPWQFMRENSCYITIIVPKGPNEEEQGFAEIESISKFQPEKEVLFNVRSRFTVLKTEDEYSKDLQYRHLILLYGAQGFREYIAKKNPVQEVSIPQNISCARCNEKAEKILFIPLADLQSGKFYCKRCLSNLNTSLADSLLCVPITHNSDPKKSSYPRKIKFKGCLLTKTEPKIPFYGYRCMKCKTEKKEFYFVCTYCDKDRNKWCEDCFEKTSNCTKFDHVIILETSPFSFWHEQMTKAELDHLSVQKELVFEGDLFQQAQMYYQNEEYEKAIKYYQDFRDENGEYNINTELADCWNNLGQIYFDKGEYNEAHEYFEKSLNSRKALEGSYPDTAYSYSNLACIYQRRREDQKANEYFKESLKILKEVYGGDKHPDIAIFYNNIAAVYFAQENYEEAKKFYLKSLKISRSVYGDSHPRIALSYDNLGRVCIKEKATEEALKYLSESLAMYKTFYGEIHLDVASSYDNIAHVYHDEGKNKEALEYFLKALDIKHSIHQENKNHPDFVDSYSNIGLVFESMGNFEAAHQNVSESLKISSSIYGQNHPIIAASYYNLGKICALEKQLKEAQAYTEQSLAKFKSFEKESTSFGEENRKKIAQVSYSLGLYSQGLKENEKALEHYFESQEIMNSIESKDHQMMEDVQKRIDQIIQKSE